MRTAGHDHEAGTESNRKCNSSEHTFPEIGGEKLGHYRAGAAVAAAAAVPRLSEASAADILPLGVTVTCEYMPGLNSPAGFGRLISARIVRVLAFTAAAMTFTFPRTTLPPRPKNFTSAGSPTRTRTASHLRHIAKHPNRVHLLNGEQRRASARRGGLHQIAR